jgi:hypothetical protein
MSNSRITREGRERERESFTGGGFTSGGGTEAAVLAKLELGRGGKCVRVRKGGDEGVARLKYQQRGEKGKRMGGLAAGGLAIHGRRALRKMGEEKRKENWGRDWVQGLNAFHWVLRKEGERGRRAGVAGIPAARVDSAKPCSSSPQAYG